VRAGLCSKHYNQQDRARGTAKQRGYDAAHRDGFRAPVLRRDDYTCQLCGGQADVADHYPRSRKQLIADGDNPNDPRFGRSLCASCHGSYTATEQGFGRSTA
jgi:5-methylcytosine-specific restriction protein A